MAEKEIESLTTRLLHGAKDLIWQEDPANRRSGSNIAQSKAKQAEPDAMSRTINAANLVAPSPTLNPMSTELLAVVMNRPTAYTAMTEAIAALADIPMDEATRYRSAFAVLKKTQQRTVEQIAQAVEVHLGLLEDEIGRFKGQSKSAEDGQITARNAEIVALNSAVENGNHQILIWREETESRIRALQDELNQKEQRARELAEEAEQKKREIAQTTQSFDAAINAVKDTLLREKNKLQQYLS